MIIQFDGVARPVQIGQTIGSLLAADGIATRFIAIQHNDSILSLDQAQDRLLSDGDRLEIVKFVAGG